MHSMKELRVEEIYSIVNHTDIVGI